MLTLEYLEQEKEESRSPSSCETSS